MNELALTESPSLRAQFADRVDVLDKVKAISLLPDGVHTTTEMVAAYYEVEAETIRKVVQRNRVELAANGLVVLRGSDLREFKRSTEGLGVPLPANLNALTLFTRRVVLNIGQLLTESQVAADVRAYLLNVEEVATREQRSQAVDMVELSKARVQMLAAAFGYLDDQWIKAKMRIQVAIGLGGQPELDPLDMPLYVPDFLKSKGLRKKDVSSEQSWFGKRAASLYEAEHGNKPGLRATDIPDGSVRTTLAWTQRDLPIFEEVWDRWYAAKYTPAPDDALFLTP
ncbi:hypothetical protein GCM10009555_018350 [Acrocarpospora macrocephala]|uniref:Uncharacterized protein n=1 Tax=Acrocarpospora macrocephala TaxID=150177 RepID=A0A5M3WEH4_9ACTN|nr:hypothetical protein [Acrocarpospora macrocephala]GES07495.1 hypothetical protein Amac_010900 [Acrocarpospora macrocephala]